MFRGQLICSVTVVQVYFPWGGFILETKGQTVLEKQKQHLVVRSLTFESMNMRPVWEAYWGEGSVSSVVSVGSRDSKGGELGEGRRGGMRGSLLRSLPAQIKGIIKSLLGC